MSTDVPEPPEIRPCRRGTPRVGAALLLASLTLAAAVTFAQSPASQPRPLAFDVASVRENRSADKPSSNLPLGPGDVQAPIAGFLRATNIPLFNYIAFAYRLTDYQEQALRDSAPAWITQERFNIEARSGDRTATKDQMRLMMRSLLADRFHLAVHYAPREVPVYALELVKPGTTGPKLQPHPADDPCPSYSSNKTAPDGTPTQPQPDTNAAGFPTYCGGILGLPASAQDRYSFGARDLPMSSIASALSSWGNLGRPVLDRTGLTGTYDFALEFTPDPRPAYATIDSGGPTFEQALNKQLGLKLVSTKGTVDFLVIDHVAHLVEN